MSYLQMSPYSQGVYPSLPLQIFIMVTVFARNPPNLRNPNQTTQYSRSVLTQEHCAKLIGVSMFHTEGYEHQLFLLV